MTKQSQHRLLRLVVVLAVVAAAVSARADSSYTGAIKDRSKICVIQDTVQEEKGVEYEHDGKRYFLCCPMCGSKLKESPEKYTQAVDPVSGVKVDKASAPAYAYRGKVFFFENEDNLNKFSATPGGYAPRTE